MAAGCGEAPPREALRDWSRSADADCRRAAAEFARSPVTPATLRDLARIAPGVRKVVDGAYSSIERRPVPEEGRTLARPFLRELGKLRTELGRAADAARDEDVDRTGAALLAASNLLTPLEEAATEAGAKACGDKKQLTALLDAGRAPIYQYVLEQLGDPARLWAQKALRIPDGQSVVARRNAVWDAGDPIEEAHTRIGGIDNPTWAEEASDAYLSRLEDVNGALAEMSNSLSDWLDRAVSRRDAERGYQRGKRKLARAVRAEERAARKLTAVMREHLRG